MAGRSECGSTHLLSGVVYESEYLDRLILSSDDAEIMEVAEEYGCEVPFQRPAELAEDDTPSMDALLHALGLATEAPGDGPRSRAGSIFLSIRSNGRRLPRGDGRAGLQDRLVRKRRPTAYSAGGRDRQAHDHVDGDGHAG